ncbi:hypothetical protein PENTCL1PPCAC_10172, partial [Pristionchus entomophagus]
PARKSASDTAPSRVSARVKARQTKSPMKPVDAVPEASQCSVCMEDLTAKRSLSFLPCTMRFIGPARLAGSRHVIADLIRIALCVVRDSTRSRIATGSEIMPFSPSV